MPYAARAANTSMTYFFVSTNPMSATNNSGSEDLLRHRSTLSGPPLYAARAISGDLNFSINEAQYAAPSWMLTAGSYSLSTETAGIPIDVATAVAVSGMNCIS